jgi:hypothetical protein
MHFEKPKMKSADEEIKANANMQFLPSSPDGTMHTAVVTLRFVTASQEKPFSYGGWRFLFTTNEKFDPGGNQKHPALRGMLINGCGKIMTVLNPMCLHGNMPLIPFEASAMARAAVRLSSSSNNGLIPRIPGWQILYLTQ